jgi:hypothetical protein
MTLYNRQLSPRFVAGVVFILIFAMAARTPLDSDVWWHMRAGETIWQSGHVLSVDTFSYTRAGMPWLSHSWLTEVSWYLLFRLGGYLALSAGVALLAALSMGLTFAQMDAPPLLRAFVLVLAATVAAVVWSPRPQAFSLVFFAATACLLYLYKWRQIDRLWLILPLFILWSNYHGGYVLGLLAIGAMIFGEILNHLLGFSGKEILDWQGILRLTLWGILAAVVVVVNPHGVAMWTAPFRTVEVGVLRQFISEWASPDFHQLVQQPFLWLLFGVLAAIGFSGKRLDGSDLLGVVGFAYLALLARRNYGPFALVAAPVLARHLWAGWQGWQRRRNSPTPLEGRGRGLARLGGLASPRLNRLFNFALLALLTLAALLKVYGVTSPALVSEYSSRLFPVKAVRWIEVNQPPGQLFNDYNWGGYLLWHLRDYPVFVDGRTDLYADEILHLYLRVLGGEDGWEETLNQYRVNLVLIEPSSALARELKRSMDWIEAYRDDVAIIFQRNP